jgi:hypothetical protein
MFSQLTEHAYRLLYHLMSASYSFGMVYISVKVGLSAITAACYSHTRRLLCKLRYLLLLSVFQHNLNNLKKT